VPKETVAWAALGSGSPSFSAAEGGCQDQKSPVA